MAEQQLDGADIRTSFQQMDCERVPKGMRCNRLVNSNDLVSLLTGLFDGVGSHGVPRHLALEKPCLRTHRSPVATQAFQQFGGQHHVTILLALPQIDSNYHTLAVDVGGLQMNSLGNAQDPRHSKR